MAPTIKSEAETLNPPTRMREAAAACDFFRVPAVRELRLERLFGTFTSDLVIIIGPVIVFLIVIVMVIIIMIVMVIIVVVLAIMF